MSNVNRQVGSIICTAVSSLLNNGNTNLGIDSQSGMQFCFHEGIPTLSGLWPIQRGQKLPPHQRLGEARHFKLCWVWLLCWLTPGQGRMHLPWVGFQTFKRGTVLTNISFHTFSPTSWLTMVLQVTWGKFNFVYGDYKLVVELSEDARWFWNASNDAHGTISNGLIMDGPVRWKDCIVKQPDGGQWTFTQTIPQTVANAAKKHPWHEAGVW